MRLSDDQLGDIRATLLAPDGAAMMDALAVWGTEGGEKSLNSDVFERARAHGWVTEAGALTSLGQSLADACRELRFWQDRNEVLAWELLGQPLDAVPYADRDIVEIGSGMGVNLVTLQKRGARVLGVEPVEAYRQIGAILWEAAGEAPVEITVAGGEATGLTEACCDVVLCISSLQYCDIHALLDEVARLLRPGGQVVIYGDSFAEYLGHIRDARKLGRKEIMTVVNSLSYAAFGRRVIPSRSGLSTTRPVYLPFGRLRGWLRARGFEEVTRHPVAGECLITARKGA